MVQSEGAGWLWLGSIWVMARVSMMAWTAGSVEKNFGRLLLLSFFPSLCFFFGISNAPPCLLCCEGFCRGFGLWLLVRKGEWAWRWEGGAGSRL